MGDKSWFAGVVYLKNSLYALRYTYGQVAETGSYLQRFRGVNLGNVLVNFPWHTKRQGLPNVDG